MKKLLLIIILNLIVAAYAFCQNSIKFAEDHVPSYMYSVGTTYLAFDNFGDEKTNTHHYELHFGYRLTDKDKIGIKLATWKLFAPMGMPMLEQLKFDEENFYPGRLRENGMGITYQRTIWKGIFAAIEILPLYKTYLDETNSKVANGFKLYTSYHAGYHISLYKNRFYLEPQIHCQYWPIDTNVPEAFRIEDDRWNNYFLFEPNLYLGGNLNF